MSKRKLELDELNDSPNHHTDLLNQFDSDSQSDDIEESEMGQTNKIEGIKRQSSYVRKIEELKKRQPNVSDSSLIPDGKQQVLKRNRRSAKECRERKKIYINLLQRKVEELNGEIEASRNQIRTDFSFVTKLIQDVDPEVKAKYLTGKVQLQKKLAVEAMNFMKAEKNGLQLQTQSQQLQNITQMFLYKYDIGGKQKKQLLTVQFQELARLLLDHKLLTFWDHSLAVNQMHEQNCFDFISFDGQQHMEIQESCMDKASHLMRQRRSEIFTIISNLKRIKDEIKDSGDRIQYLAEQLGKLMPQQQIFQFLLHPLFTSPPTTELSIDMIKEEGSPPSPETVKKIPL